MSKLPTKIQSIQNELTKLAELKNFEQTQRVILSVVKLLDDTISEDDLNLFQLFNDSDGKIRANATWFYEDQVIADRKATYRVHADNELNIDFKAYGVNKAKKQVISWATALTPNFEDEPFNSKFNIGIDFIVPRATDRVIIVLTNNYVIRTLELKEDITATYQEILAKWTEIKDFTNKSAVHNALWESFDLQPLNKKFYAGISERFITLRQHLIKEEILDEKHSSMFANRLIGRVIFTWFLDKKGIINSDLKYFDSQSFQSDTEYYKTKLERLFFGVLNTPIEEREYKDDVTSFLNGGLFEARENDLYNQNRLSFPKNYFDDLFEFLSAYNFTTDESTSQFQQVAIDPEMLGRIFENLLAEIKEETGEQARKAKGAFYTPREIVDYMCKESLREYLKTKLTEDTYRDQRLYQLIDAPDKDFQDQDHNWRRDWKPYKDAILSALDDLKVLDPACGSGAFPIGMLQLLVRVYERLEPRFDGYKAKLQIIERNIYGVDVEPMAVEIARLRTWLSIIVDEESDSRKIKPLPNLEFKFVCANSLIDLDQSGASAFGDVPNLENKLRDLRDAYFNTESLTKKKKLRNDYDLLVNTGEGLWGESGKSKQLKTYRPFDNESSASFFNPDFMFGLENFSIVIGNPPYGVSLKDEERKEITKSLGKVPDYEIYYYFIELAKKLLAEDGVNSYIIPNTFLFNVFATDYRKSILENWSINILIDCTAFKLFDSATVSNAITVFSKTSNATLVGYKNTLEAKNFDELLKRETLFISKDELLLNNINWGLAFKLSPEILNIISKLKLSGQKLANVFPEISQGLIAYDKHTGQDEVIIKNRSLHHLKKINDSVKEWLWGEDVTPYQVKWNGKEYIDYGTEVANPRLPKYFKGKRILIREITNPKIYAGFTDKELYHDPAIIVILDSGKYLLLLLGILNSKLATFYHFNASPKATKGAFPKILVKDVRDFPFPKFDKEGQEKITEQIESLVNEIIKTKSTDSDLEIKEIQNQIDELVMDLYGLDDNEKVVVRNSIK